MVKVPVYQGNVDLRPVHRQGVEGRAIEGAFGGGRGLMALADGVGRLGAALGQARELEDMTRAKDGENEFARHMQERMYGENGYMLSQGKGAFEGRKTFMEEAEKKRLEIAASLSKGAQKHYNQASTARMLGINQQALIHAGNAQKQWVREASSARQEIFAQDALGNVGNKEQIDRSIAAGILEMREQARLEGMGVDALAVKEKAYVSAVQANVVRAMAGSDPLAADAYMKEVADQLEPKTRLELEGKLEGPLLHARGKRNADLIGADLIGADLIGADLIGADLIGADLIGADLIGADLIGADLIGADLMGQGMAGGGQGGQADVVVDDMPGGAGGTANYMDVARKFIGQHEVHDGQALSQFIKRAAGISIDPRVTPWCAGFVNAVLGAAGMKGTGKLNARSFLNFGQATSNPKLGDIVVLSRGDPNGWQGHVGFFQGYDKNGNVLVLGGNQGDRVSVAPYKADRVLGFRNAGRVDEATMALPNYQMGGLALIEGRLAKIADPREREATRAELERRQTLQKKAIDAARDETMDWIDRQMATWPEMDVNSLPVEMQAQIGLSGMNRLRDYQKKALETGGIKTDELVFYELQTHYADDPDGFGALDLFEYRDKLSDADWRTVTGWRQKAREDVRKGGAVAGADGLGLAKAMSQARVQLEAVGISTTDKKGNEKTTAMKREAGFQRALLAELDAFMAQNKRAAGEREVGEIINRLLLPVVISRPGMLWGTNERDGFLFEAGERKPDEDVRARTDDVPMPIDIRMRIINNLLAEGKPVSEDNIAARWFEFMTSTGALRLDEEIIAPQEDERQQK